MVPPSETQQEGRGRDRRRRHIIGLGIFDGDRRFQIDAPNNLGGQGAHSMYELAISVVMVIIIAGGLLITAKAFED